MNKKNTLAVIFITSAGLSACAVTNNPKLEVKTEPERAGCTVTKPILDHIRNNNVEMNESSLEQRLNIKKGREKIVNYNAKPPVSCQKPN
jgi:hypothetical protein